MRRPVRTLAPLLALLCLSGCAHYRLGTQDSLTFHTLHVAPVENRAVLPQAQATVSTEIRNAFLRDGRVGLVNSGDSADATLEVTLTDYNRSVATVRPGDTGLARKFTVTLGAQVTLRDNRNGKPLFENRRITVSRESFTDSGQLQAEYQLLPLLAEALAQRVTHAALDVW